MQRKRFSAKSQKVFIGIDVHLKSWFITILYGSVYQKSFDQPPSAEALITFLRKNFPNCEYYAVYESGFTGFSTYYELEAVGIHTAVINAADVPTTQKEAVMKNDRSDSKKLAEALRDEKFEPVYIHPKDVLDDRSLVRLRKKYVQEESINRVRIKHLLHNNGVDIPSEFRFGWSRAYAQWLREEVQLLGETKNTLLALVQHVEVLHKEYLSINAEVRKLIRSEHYVENVRRLMTIPGIGATMAITLLVEIGDFSRFPNSKTFASVLGLIPTSHSSGDKVSMGEMTFRGNKYIGSMFIECCWKLVQRDFVMAQRFEEWSKRMVKYKAIIKVARKLSDIIFSMMKNGTDYDSSKI